MLFRSVTGIFTGTSFTVGLITTLFNSGADGTEDGFVAKFDASGSPLWAVGFGGATTDDAYGVAMDGSGAVYLGGRFASNAITLGATTLTNTVQGGLSFDGLVAKFSASGTPIWARAVTGNGDETVTSIAATTAGEIAAAGWGTADTSFYLGNSEFRLKRNRSN